MLSRNCCKSSMNASTVRAAGETICLLLETIPEEDFDQNTIEYQSRRPQVSKICKIVFFRAKRKPSQSSDEEAPPQKRAKRSHTSKTDRKRRNKWFEDDSDYQVGVGWRAGVGFAYALRSFFQKGHECAPSIIDNPGAS